MKAILADEKERKEMFLTQFNDRIDTHNVYARESHWQAYNDAADEE